jgi:hypothetical protein
VDHWDDFEKKSVEAESLYGHGAGCALALILRKNHKDEYFITW